MIVFLTIVYCAVVFALIKVKILKPTLLVKLSPVGFLLLMLICLFIPMMFWAPSGNVIITKTITRITPQVTGTVVKIHAQPNQRVKKGDPLVTLDPTPYQDTVNSLKAQLAAAKQNVLELKASLDAATSAVAQAKAQQESLKASLEAATSAVAQAKAQRDSLKSQLDAAGSAVVKDKAARDLAKAKLKFLDDTKAQDPGAVSKLQYEQGVQSLAEAEATVKVALANEQTARTNYESVALATIQTAIANESKARTAYAVEAPANIETAQANEVKARLAYTSEINGVNTKVAQVQAELAKAEWNLGQTTVYAPANGYVTDFVLAEGSAIATLAGMAMINFISDDEPASIISAIQEKNLRYVQPGQVAEVVLPLYPGETLSGKVTEVVWVTGEGQIMPQAGIPMVKSRVKTGGEFAVKIALDPEWASYHQPIGAGGIAAIYTDRGKPTHVIRKVMVRMTAWTNYVFQMPGQ